LGAIGIQNDRKIAIDLLLCDLRVIWQRPRVSSPVLVHEISNNFVLRWRLTRWPLVLVEVEPEAIASEIKEAQRRRLVYFPSRLRPNLVLDGLEVVLRAPNVVCGRKVEVVFLEDLFS
jgi:hypothetical protein